jgi:N-acylneuraminate cytidylyltransferase
MRVAIIPARGGSKRIPRKNIREFGGKPMIAHSIESALRSGLFERVIVSTDDPEIAAVAREHGADVPFLRPPELSDDHANTTEVVAHAIDFLRAQGTSPETVCCIYATAPFVQIDDLARAAQIFEHGRWSYVFAATTYAFTVFRSFRKAADGSLQMVFPEHQNTRSQDLPEALHDAGQFYFGKAQAWLDGEPVFGARSTVLLIPRWRVQDIDNEDDWMRAEAMSRYLAPMLGQGNPA